MSFSHLTADANNSIYIYAAAFKMQELVATMYLVENNLMA
jgi:hypothetical protein